MRDANHSNEFLDINSVHVLLSVWFIVFTPIYFRCVPVSMRSKSCLLILGIAPPRHLRDSGAIALHPTSRPCVSDSGLTCRGIEQERDYLICSWLFAAMPDSMAYPIYLCEAHGLFESMPANWTLKGIYYLNIFIEKPESMRQGGIALKNSLPIPLPSNTENREASAQIFLEQERGGLGIYN